MSKYLPINYEKLGLYLVSVLGDVDYPYGVEFDIIHDYLTEHAEVMLSDPETRTEEYEDMDLTEVLLEEHTFGVIKEIIVTRSPGIVVSVDDHLLKLPLVLIKF